MELYVVAVWTSGSSDAFIPVTEGTPTCPAEIAVDPAFLTRVVTLAKLHGQRGTPLEAAP
jgi:hypothetical protein